MLSEMLRFVFAIMLLLVANIPPLYFARFKKASLRRDDTVALNDHDHERFTRPTGIAFLTKGGIIATVIALFAFSLLIVLSSRLMIIPFDMGRAVSVTLCLLLYWMVFFIASVTGKKDYVLISEMRMEYSVGTKKGSVLYDEIVNVSLEHNKLRIEKIDGKVINVSVCGFLNTGQLISLFETKVQGCRGAPPL